jgi:flagellar hook assembly protein FlgD
MNHSTNYPNPFNPITQIEFSLSHPGYTELTIYNSLGQKVRTVVNRYLVAGSYLVDWNGRDDSVRQLSSGVYIYRLRQGNVVVQKKMVLVR